MAQVYVYSDNSCWRVVESGGGSGSGLVWCTLHRHRETSDRVRWHIDRARLPQWTGVHARVDGTGTLTNAVRKKI